MGFITTLSELSIDDFGPWLVVLIGVICLLVAIKTYSIKKKLWTHPVPVDGKIAKMERKWNTNSTGKSCQVYVSFTSNGKTYCFPLPFRGSGLNYRVGKPLRLVYPKGNPKEVTLNSFFYKWDMPLVLTLIGSVFTIAGFFILKSEGLI